MAPQGGGSWTLGVGRREPQERAISSEEMEWGSTGKYRRAWSSRPHQADFGHSSFMVFHVKRGIVHGELWQLKMEALLNGSHDALAVPGQSYLKLFTF